jgi:cell division protein ZapA (FtsZ GTPase activity inhibitor)
MNHGTAGVKVISILGEDYSIKAPAGEEQTLLDAAMMLKATLEDTKRKYPTLIGDRLLVLAAMNLCSQQIERTRPLSRASQRHGRHHRQDHQSGMMLLGTTKE